MNTASCAMSTRSQPRRTWYRLPTLPIKVFTPKSWLEQVLDHMEVPIARPPRSHVDTLPRSQIAQILDAHLLAPHM